MSLASEHAQIERYFGYGESVRAVAATMPESDAGRVRLLAVAHDVIADAGPVRVSVAAHMLELSEPTVRDWAKTGVLLPLGDRRTLRLDPHRLYDVLALVKALRAEGRSRNLLDAVWYRLGDQALLEREDLADSIEQMRRGEGRVIHEG